MNSSDELEKIEKISENSLYSAGIMPIAIKHCFKILKRYIKGNKVLELGPAEGIMTELLMTLETELTVVEGSTQFCQKLRERYPKAKVIHSLFENFEPSEQFDSIVLGHLLEHVQDPVVLLGCLKKWLAPNGIVFAAVPNARSLHRQAAVLMKMLPAEDALNEMDLHHGHRRVFTPESFRNCFLNSGMNIEVFGGYWIKPISNSQIEKNWNTMMIEAFMQLGERYPDIAAELYVVASSEK